MSEATDHLLRLPAVMRETGLGRSTIYRLMNDGHFPRSVQVSPKLVSWWESEVHEWLRNRPRTQRASERASSQNGNVLSREKSAA